MNLLLCGLGGYFLTQIVKMGFPKRPWFEMVAALVGAAGIATVLFHHQVSDLGVYGVAGAGLTVVINRVSRLLFLVGDWFVRQILLSRGKV